jgi:DedD protein
MTKNGLVRNLEQIQETDTGQPGSRLGRLLLVSMGGACVMFAVLSQVRRPAGPPAGHAADPLGALVAQARTPAAAQSSDLGGKEVTFPSRLSDGDRTTTAMAAVRPNNAAHPQASAEEPESNPPAEARLPVVPLPAKNVVSASPVVNNPGDVLTKMAKEASAPSDAPVEEGRAGGYQLQTSSFRKEADATAFATALRQRGHRAYVEAAQVSGRGTFFRVRIGPFKTQREAASYRSEFENREHLVPFLVEPPRDQGPSKTASKDKDGGQRVLR